MLALLNRWRDHMAAREQARAPAQDSHCVAASTSAAVAIHQQAIEQDALAWAYRMLASPDAAEPVDLECMDAFLDQLAPQQLLIVNAWFRRELTCGEIALAQGISRQEARARVREVLKALDDAQS